MAALLRYFMVSDPREFWGWESDIDVSTVWVHISNIRKKLRKIQSSVDIRFIRNTGYILEVNQ